MRKCGEVCVSVREFLEVVPESAEEDGLPAFVPTREPICLGALMLRTRYLLAPLAGYTNLGFRTAIRELGGLGLATTDLINARALLLQSRKTLEMIRTGPHDRPLAVQIYGTNPVEMRDAAQWLEDYGVSAVDINMGCPVHKVTRGGGGSALMCDKDNTVMLARTVVESVKIPVTVKMRLGWDDSSLSAPYFARAFEDAGVAAVTIHGRTREQGFAGRVNLAGIQAVVEAVHKMPVIGNGDIRTIADAARMLTTTGCHGIAIGRGALLNPWFFLQLDAWERTGEPGRVPSYEERLAFMHRHFMLLVQDRGERFGCLCFRKVANWYCRVLKPGKEIQQQLVRLEDVDQFEAIHQQLRERKPTGMEPGVMDEELCIPVPKGPIEHW
jgi:nifR3 family TIM-barrel protein